MQTLTPAEFLGTPVSILDHAGRRWLAARDVGRCLGYAEDHARHAVLKLFTRHADEFGPEDTGVVNLTTPGGPQQTRIFSHTGCVLLAMFANTGRAKDFRAWAKRVLAGGRAAAALPPAGAEPTARISRAVERQAMELFVAGMTIHPIARRLGISAATVSRLLSGQYRFGPHAGQDETTPALIAAVAAERARRERERITEQFIASAANLRLQQALEQVGRRLLAALEAADAAPAAGAHAAVPALAGLEG